MLLPMASAPVMKDLAPTILLLHKVELKSAASTHPPFQLERTGPSPRSLKLRLSGHMPLSMKPIITPSPKSVSFQAREARRPRGQKTQNPVLLNAGHAGGSGHAPRLVAGELGSEAVQHGVVGVQDSAGSGRICLRRVNGHH